MQIRDILHEKGRGVVTIDAELASMTLSIDSMSTESAPWLLRVKVRK